MGKITTTALIGIAILAVSFLLPYNDVLAKGKMSCVTIQDGVLVDSLGNIIEMGYDSWGYNYQGHMFNGFYDNYSRPSEPVLTGDKLIMKWNDAWLSNQDCDGDGLLDRHFGYDSYIDSGAWLTNHIEWYDEDGKKYMYFCKIIAVSSSDTLVDGIWYNADGEEIGLTIWGQFAIIQEVEQGVLYLSPTGPGLGAGHMNP